MDLRRLAHGRSEGLDVEAGGPDGVEYHGLSPDDGLDGFGQQRRYIERDHHRAVLVGVNQASVLDDHAEDVHLAADINHVDIRVARADAAPQEMESLGALVQVSNGAVGYRPQRAEALMQRGVDLPPPGRGAGLRIGVLDDDDGRAGTLRRVLVVLQRPAPFLVGAEARRPSDHRRARVPDHRRKGRVGGDQRLPRVADRARPLGSGDLQGVADRRGVRLGQRGQEGLVDDLVLGVRLSH